MQYQPLKTALYLSILCVASLQGQDSSKVAFDGDTLILKDPFGGHFENFTDLPSFSKGDQPSSKLQLPRFRGQDQGSAPWCWAACASMVLYHAGLKLKPCEIVSQTLNKNCCDFFMSPSCYTPGNVQNALRMFQVYTATIPMQPSLTEATRQVKKELQNGKPVIIVLRPQTPSKGRTSHVIVIYGIEGLHQQVAENVKFVAYDPLTGGTKLRPRELLNYSNMPNGYVYTWSSTVKITHRSNEAKQL